MQRRSALIVPALIAAMLGAGCPAIAESVDEATGSTCWLSYRQSRETQSLLRYLGRQQLEVSADQPADLKLPENAGHRVNFARWMTPMDAAGFRQLALSASAEGGLYDQLIIDANGNGRLDDEAIQKAYFVRSSSGRGMSYFGPIAVQFETADGPITYHLNLMTYRPSDDQVMVWVYAGCWYEGTVELNGKATPIQLIDYGGDGTFNETCSEKLDYGSADRLRFSTKAEDEPMPAGPYIRVDGQLVQVTPSQDGACLTIRSAAGLAVGSIVPPASMQMVRVFGPQGCFEVQQDAGHVVPAGQYRLEQWQQTMADDKHHEWRFTGRSFPDNSIFTVAADQQVALDTLGTGLTAKVTERGDAKGQHYFNQTLTGSLGETVSVSFANGGQVPAPRLKIVSADGKYDKTFKFEYG